MLLRSLLFAPANRPDFVAKFASLAADAFVLDLEDGTPPGARAAARETIGAAIAGARGGNGGRASVLVRVNEPGSDDLAADLAVLSAVPPDALVVPKIASPADVAAVRARCTGALAGVPIVAGVESLGGVLRAESIATADGVVGLYFGAEDYVAEIGGRRTRESTEVLYARSHVVLAARAGRVAAIDQAVTDIRDDDLFRGDASLGRDLGYTGKICLNPRQVQLANEAFAPSAAEVDRARRLVAAYEAAQAEGRGTIDFEGRMVDPPVLKAALAVLEAQR